MSDKDRAGLHAAAFLLGIVDAHGNEVDEDVSRNHDWTKFLLARDMYPRDDFAGPDWVPFNLWSMYEPPHASTFKIAETLIFTPGAKEIWGAIEQSYDHPNNIATQLPLRILETQEEWRLLSKRKPSDHLSHFLRLKASATALASEVERIEELETRETGEQFDFTRLYNEIEKKIVYQNVRVYNLRLRNMIAMEAKGRKRGYKPGDFVGVVGVKDWAEYNAPDDPSKAESPTNLSLAGRDARPLFELLCGDEDDWPGIVPKVANMLRRLASYFDHESRNPPLKRPVFANAQRNHFARGLCRFFVESFGSASPSIISRIVCLFHEQGITENEVSQMIKKMPRDRALESENSHQE